MEYSVLVLPKIETMRPELLAKIQQLVKDGVVLQGPAPRRSPSLENYPEADIQVQTMANQMWQSKIYPFAEKVEYGNGFIYPNASLEQILADRGVQPDFTVSDPMLPVLFIHLTTEDGEVYFVSNQTEETISFDANFRVKGMQPELWDPETSEVRYLPVCKSLTGVSSVPMTMAPLESAFIVFREPAKNLEGENFPEAELIAAVDGPWTIEFEKGKGGPEQAVITENLFDWMESENPQIKYFSGTAKYTASFTIDKMPADQIYVDLGEVMVMAKVKVNGQDAGGVWTMPYQVNVTDFVKEGENTIEVEVVNCWRNRLVGECSMPKKERFTFHTAADIDAESDLQSSGLLGPVQLIAYPYQIVK